ncbi:hypothetical protein L3081_20080 [Colwellia sp. MSW7]|uniref:Uncharacterized protein n=1 Tax=Colwellia maritima TaxID=2912588 RepID=A0ABS9X870_9GAMM|nr:hypothetical protein [Colwellia maritima]MCI2285257.1 hypothetical protein [Colwellia maritima]
MFSSVDLKYFYFIVFDDRPYCCLKQTVTNALKTDTKLRERIAGWYRLSDDTLLNNKVNEVLSVFRSKLESKILVVE